MPSDVIRERIGDNHMAFMKARRDEIVSRSGVDLIDVVFAYY